MIQLNGIHLAKRTIMACSVAFVVAFIAAGAYAEEPRFLKETFPGGIKLKEPVAFYDVSDLYEYINGQAVFYFSYQFSKLEHGYYEHDGGAYYVDVYELGSPLSAFGSYRQQREEGAEPLDVGTEGALTDYLAVFCKDKFYVEIIPMESSSDDAASMKAIAANVAAAIPGSTAMPSELNLFPKNGLVAGSERYVDENLISYTFMGRGLVAHYKLPGIDDDVRVFIGMPDSEAQATAIYDEYRGKLQNPADVSLGDAKAVSGGEQYRGTTIVATWKNYIFGCLDVKDAEKSTALLNSVLDNLKR